MADIAAAGLLLLYFLIFAATLGLVGHGVGLSREWLRKLYHVASSLSVLILVGCFGHWSSAVIGISALLLLAYALILLGSRIPFASAAIDRGAGIVEVREHLLQMLLAVVLLLWLFWGVLGDDARYAVVVGVMLWGVGDASAALVGVRYAERRYTGWLADADKSPLGTAAMIAACVPVAWAVLLIMTSLPVMLALVPALTAAASAGLIEAVTRNGHDTLTVPLAAAAAVYPVAEAVLWVSGGPG